MVIYRDIAIQPVSIINSQDTRQAMRILQVKNNLFIGHLAGQNNLTANYNTFIGYYTGGANTTGTQDHFVGFQAGNNNSTDLTIFSKDMKRDIVIPQVVTITSRDMAPAPANTTGGNNLFEGYQAGSHNTVTYYNQFIGYQAGYTNTLGADDHFIGYQAGTTIPPEHTISSKEYRQAIIIQQATVIISADSLPVITIQ
jgi:hypothetical protein